MQLVSVEALQATFGAVAATVKLVVLDACHSDVQAEALVAQVDYVVGTAGSLHDGAARSFAVGLYGGLGERATIAEAYQQGCAAISLEGNGGASPVSSRRPRSRAGPARLRPRERQLLLGRSLSKTGTDPSELIAEPVIVTEPRPEDIAHAQRASRRGKDNVLRFTPINVTVLNFTAHQLVIYSCVLDVLTGNALNEGTDEYFYGDVVSVSTKTKNYGTVTRGGKTIQIDAAEMFQLTTSGGISIEVFLRAPTIIQLMGHGEIPTTRAEAAIQAVRKMLREKKAALVA